MKKIIQILSEITIVCVTCSVFSSCNQEEKPADLSVSADTLYFGPDSSSQELLISCNTEWSISYSADWLSITETASDGNATILVTVKPNNNTESRITSLIVDAGNKTKQVEVIQKGTSDTVPEFHYDIPPDNTDMRDLTSIELTTDMGVGWNIGNSLDATDGETSWGNPLINKQLIDSVKAAGFKSVRIPVAWSKFSDEPTFRIETSWLKRVEEVVNYVLDNEMYAIINIHWDGGWMQPTYDEEDYVNERLSAMWKQIATYFRNYNDYLLFAGSNEVMVNDNYGTPTKEYYTVQNGFNQTFVNTVRSTGGRNVYRHLVVQGFNTNIGYTVSYAVVPTDVTPNRLMMEVHYYDPYNFTLNKNSSITQWGSTATDPSKKDTWGDEAYADEQFQKMKTNFIDKGTGVILGEYGVISKQDDPENEANRQHYLEYITHSIYEHGLVPFYWDNGYTDNYGMGIFDRNTGTKAYPDLIEAIIGASK